MPETLAVTASLAHRSVVPRDLGSESQKIHRVPQEVVLQWRSEAKMTRKTFAMSALVSGILLLHTARVMAQLTPYDDFERLRLGPSRWVAFTNLTQSLEIVRKIQEGKLALESRRMGKGTRTLEPKKDLMG